MRDCQIECFFNRNNREVCINLRHSLIMNAVEDDFEQGFPLFKNTL